jgi:choline-sulfatase
MLTPLKTRTLCAFGLVALAAVAFASARAGPRTSARSPDLLLITVDTLRPDALGWVGGRNPTPAIDGLAREGFRFPAAVSPVPLTLPSHLSILTGLLPRRHGVRDNGQVFPDRKTLAALLAGRGYSTAAFVSGYPLRAEFGVDAGFGFYDDRLPAGAEGWRERAAPATTAAALDWIRSAKSPWFVWVHYYDPHDPYAPPPPYRRPGSRGAYDGEVAFADSAIGELLRGIPASRRNERVTVFAGDHGEGLGEQGEKTHGYFLYEKTVLVPLIFHAPGRLKPGESPAPARLVDVAPTALALLGAPPIGVTDGVSLLPILSGKPQQIPGAYLETLEPWLTYGWAPLSAIRKDGWKLIRAPRPELYDLVSDPAERKNVIEQNRTKAIQMLAELDRLESKRETSAGRVDDPQTVARLRALGYVGAGSAGEKPPRGLPDPKDRVAERDRLLEAESLLRTGRFDAAVAAFDDVLRTDPGNRFATLRSGVALLKKGNLRDAIPRLERAVAVDPHQPESRFALADALTRTGQFSRAVVQWAETARLQPRRAEVWSNLGMLLARTGKPVESVRAFERAVALEPRNPALRTNLAYAQRATGRRKAALENLRKAQSLGPQDRFPYSGTLGLLLLQDGSTEEAVIWLRRSRPGEVDFAESRFELAALELRAGNTTAAKRALGEAITANPKLRARAEASSTLARLLSR